MAVSQSLSGSVTTTERLFAARAVFYQGTSDIYSYWNNSMPANSSATLWKGNAKSTSIYSTSGFHTADEFGWSGITSSTWYNLSLSTASRTGAWNSSERPASSAGQVSSSPALDSSFTCQFETQSTSISMWGYVDSNLVGGNVTVQWFSSTAGLGWLTYYSDGTGFNLTQTATKEQTWSGNGTVEWATEIHGLEPGVVIEVHVFSATTTGCYTDEDSYAFVIDTSNGFAFTEVDNPYDSITESGGGATLYWSFWNPIPTSDFLGGTILCWNDTSYRTMTTQNVSSLWVLSKDWTLSNYGANITPSNLNQKYTAEIFLNFTYNSMHTAIVSAPVTFVYQKDTSGDGLTDAEKERGWYVPVINAFGGATDYLNGSTWVQASPSLWATNGLVSDYVEKEYDLDPQTIDTAGSHMLDTWNLTFNMGTDNHTCPSYFECWYENSTNPLPGGYIGNGSATNLSATGPSSEGDTYSWASKVLWAKSELGYLQDLIVTEHVGWLRAVTGTDGSTSTLTVWGKLSWGANPLASSTLQDGIPDGERVNPIATVGVDVSGVFSNATTHLANGDGYAVKMTAYNGSGTSGTEELANYSSEGIVGQSSIANYSATIPVGQTSQFVTVELQVVADNDSVLSPLWLNSSSQSFTRIVDLVQPHETTFSYGGSGTWWGQVSGEVQSLWTGYKVPTWLWLPDDNSTVNGLPAGLERYTGEDSFDMVVVNSTSSIESQAIPLPWGGDAAPRINVSAGLNDFLIPREQFLYSTFGQAILRGYAPYNSTNPNPSLVGSYGRGVISSFDGGNWMINLGAYWQNRAINNGQTGNITPSTETGTNDSSIWNVQVTAVKSTPANNSGGIQDVGGLYNASDTPPALQSIVTLNVTNQTNLDLLIAALFDNTSGVSTAVNGTFQSVTYFVDSLNLPVQVTSAVPTVAVTGDGLYGAPVSVPPRPSNSEWGDFWNAVTSIIENPGGAIVSLATVIWSATVSAMTFFNHIAHEALAIGAIIVERTPGALDYLGRLVVQGLQWLVSGVLTLVEEALAAVIDPIRDAAAGYVSTLIAAANLTVSDVVNGGSDNGDVTQAHAESLFVALSGDIMVLALAVGITTTVVLTLLSPIDLGANIVTGIIMTLLTVGALFAFAAFTTFSALSVDEIWGAEALFNLTVTRTEQGAALVDWRALAESVGFAGSIVDTPLAIYLGVDVMENEGPIMWPTVALVFDMISLVITGLVWASSNEVAVDIAFVMSLVGMGASLMALRTAGSQGLFSAVDLGLGLTGVSAAGYDAAHTW
jgi:hypothetical protein